MFARSVLVAISFTQMVALLFALMATTETLQPKLAKSV